MKLSTIRNFLVSGVLAAAVPFIAPSDANAALNSCITRTVFTAYSGATWLSQTVCSAGEIAVSAGGFCSASGHMVGVSTTSGTSDRLVWLWCSSAGNAYWYAMCCKP